MKKYIIFKYTDENFYFYDAYNDKIIIENIKSDKMVENLKIIDVGKFLSTLEEKIKNNKLNNLLIKNKIYILIPSYYNKTDYFLLRYIFKTLNYYNFEFIEEQKLYKKFLVENTSVINIWDNLGEISYLERDKIISIPYTLENIKSIKQENVILINNTSLKKMDIKDKRNYYIEPQKYYLIEELKKQL